ncbi:MAG: hypothetical protein JO276_03820 [Sphingomonadaceae bacterium]|nr:hypothetical protein [Alphaproteobacteria bacterium]MBV9882114.1 hypothetical protein [Sphingomonadaceae bacterium]
MRAVGGIIAGLIVAMVVTILVGIIGLRFTFSVPSNVDAGNAQALLDTLGGMSAAAQLTLAAAWLLGGLAGAWVARRIAGAGWPAWIVTLLVAAYVLLNTLILPMPGWMQVVWIAAPLIGGLIGNHLGRGTAAPAAATTDEAGDAPAAP